MKYALFITESDVDLACHLVLADRTASFATPLFLVKTAEYVDLVLAAGYAALTYRELYQRYPAEPQGGADAERGSDLSYEAALLVMVGWERYSAVFGSWLPVGTSPPEDPLDELRRQAGRLHAVLRALCRELRPVFASVWNGLFLPTCAAAAALAECGVPRHFCEEGFFPKTMVFDGRGVNFASELAQRGRFEAPPAPAQAAVASFLKSFRSAKESRVAADPGGLLPQLPPGRMIFYPAQIDSDTNIVLASPAFPTNASVVRSLKEALAGLPDCFLVVKTHPRDRASLEDLQRWSDARTLVTAGGNIHDWIAASHLVVTRNSTVGLEALCYRKAVLTLGDSLYSGHGFTVDVRHPARLAQAVSGACEAPAGGDEDSFQGFLWELLHRHTFWLDEPGCAPSEGFVGRLRDMAQAAPEVAQPLWIESRSAESRSFRRRLAEGEGALRALSGLGVVKVALLNCSDRADCSAITEWLRGLLPQMRLACAVLPDRAGLWRFLRSLIPPPEMVVIVTSVLSRSLSWRVRLAARLFPGRTVLVDKRLKVVTLP
jgi:hypothetical protein